MMALQFISCSRLSMEGEMLTSVPVSKPVQEFQAKQGSMREGAYWRSCFPVAPVCFSLPFYDDIEWSRSLVLKEEFNKHLNETCAADSSRAPSPATALIRHFPDCPSLHGGACGNFSRAQGGEQSRHLQGLLVGNSFPTPSNWKL